MALASQLDEDLRAGAETLAMMEEDVDSEVPRYVLDYVADHHVAKVPRTRSWCLAHWSQCAQRHCFSPLIGLYLYKQVHLNSSAEFKQFFTSRTQFDTEVVLPARAMWSLLDDPVHVQQNAAALRRFWDALP